MENKKMYIDVINETVEFYGQDPVNRRSVTEDGDCLYNGPDGKQCAVGRCATNIPSEYEDTGVSSLFYEMDTDFLKPEYRHLDSCNFWDSLQSLHDGVSNWDLNKGGLTDSGKKLVNYLKETYGKNS